MNERKDLNFAIDNTASEHQTTESYGSCQKDFQESWTFQMKAKMFIKIVQKLYTFYGLLFKLPFLGSGSIWIQNEKKQIEVLRHHSSYCPLRTKT